MKLNRIISLFIIFYLYLISFEWAIFSSISDLIVIQKIRLVFDLLPSLVLILSFLFINQRVKKIEFNLVIVIILILLISSISLLIEIKSIRPIITNLGVTFRYFPFLILVRLASKNFKSEFLTHIKSIFIILIVLSILELLNKNIFIGLMLPNPIVFGSTLPTSYWDDSISTTFINTVEYSFFILALSSILMFNEPRVFRKWLVLFVAFLLIFMSNSVATILSIFILLFYITKRKEIFGLVFLCGIIIFTVFNKPIVKNLTGFDSIEAYVKVSNDYNRIGYFTKLLPEFFKNDPKDIILGIGADENVVNAKLKQYENLPIMLTYGGNNLKLLKDVYWIYLIIVLGAINFSLFILLLYGIYRYVKKKASFNDFLLIKCFLTYIFFLGFFNQVLDIKSFSFCFWTMVGVSWSKILS